MLVSIKANHKRYEFDIKQIVSNRFGHFESSLCTAVLSKVVGKNCASPDEHLKKGSLI